MILDENKLHQRAKILTSAGANQVMDTNLDAVVRTDTAVADVKSNVSILARLWCFQTPLSSFTSILLIPFLLLSGSCGSSPKEAADAQSQRSGSGEGRNRVTPVDVAIARTGLLETQPEYTGNTVPFRVVSLRSQVEARLLALNVDVGDTVKQGQNIGQLDEAILLTELKQAEAELAALKSEVARIKNQVSNARAEVERARLQLVQAQADSARQQKLFQAGAIAEQVAQQTRTQAQTAAQALRAAQEQVRTEQQAVAAAEGRVVAQQAVVAQAKERRSYTRLTSPINGVVTGKATEPGNLLQAGGEVLNIGDFNRVKIVVQVSELELAQIQLGQAVQVRLDAFPNQTFVGRVIRISPAADATARLIPVEVVIPNNGKIGSGLLARVKFENQTVQRVLISQAAIQKQAKGNQSNGRQQTQTSVGQSSSPDIARTNLQNRTGTIFIVTDAEGKAKVTSRAVKLGKTADGRVEVLSGLQPGERYVVRSGKPLKDGETVNLSVLSETADSAPRSN